MTQRTLFWVMALGLAVMTSLAHGEGIAKIEERPQGLGLAIGLYSTYYDLTGRELFRHINRLDEKQDFTPSQISLSYDALRWQADGYQFGLSVEGMAFLKPLVAETGNDNSFYGDGDLEWTPYFLSLRFKHYTRWGLVPYFSTGVAYIKSNFNANRWYTLGFDSPGEFDSARDTRRRRYFRMDDYSLGWHIGAGAEYFFNKNLALNLDIKYLIGDAYFNYQIYVNDSLEINDRGKFVLDSLLIGLGIKYYF